MRDLMLWGSTSTWAMALRRDSGSALGRPSRGVWLLGDNERLRGTQQRASGEAVNDPYSCYNSCACARSAHTVVVRLRHG